jgi:hypothetical protein
MEFSQLGLSNNHLITSSNLNVAFNRGDHVVMSGLNLKSSAAASPIDRQLMGEGARTLTQTHGATDTIYFSSHLSKNQRGYLSGVKPRQLISGLIAACLPSRHYHVGQCIALAPLQTIGLAAQTTGY